MTAAEPSRAIDTATIEDTSLLAFYRDMNQAERQTFWACSARLGARWHGLHDLSARDRNHHRAVEGRSRRGRPGGALSNTTSLANAIAIFAVFFLAAFALPETRGRMLHADGFQERG
jgi:hypothetical protein